NFKCCVDADAPMYFTWSTIVHDRVGSGSCLKATTGTGEFSILDACEESGCHGDCLKRRTRNVVSAKCSTYQRVVTLVCFETNPRGFVFNILQAVRRFTIQSKNFAGLRINYYNSA